MLYQSSIALAGFAFEHELILGPSVWLYTFIVFILIVIIIVMIKCKW